MATDSLTAGFILIVIGLGGMLYWSRLVRSQREAILGKVAGNG